MPEFRKVLPINIAFTGEKAEKIKKFLDTYPNLSYGDIFLVGCETYEKIFEEGGKK